MRAMLAVLIYLAAVPPALATGPDPLPITCKLIDTDDIARLLGAPLGPPSFDWVMVCAGVCAPGDGRPTCVYPVGNRQDSGRATTLRIGLYLPPGEQGIWPAMLRFLDKDDPYTEIRDMPWRGGFAIWRYDAGQGMGELDVFIRHRGHLEVTIDGNTSKAVTLHEARLIATKALARFYRATPQELAPPKWNWKQKERRRRRSFRNPSILRA